MVNKELLVESPIQHILYTGHRLGNSRILSFKVSRLPSHYIFPHLSFQKRAEPLNISIAMSAKKPIIAARPFNSSAFGVKGPNVSLVLLYEKVYKDAAMKRNPAKEMTNGVVSNCVRTVALDASSAPRAAVNPSIAKRPFTISGTIPENPINSLNVGYNLVEAPAAAGVAVTGAGCTGVVA